MNHLKLHTNQRGVALIVSLLLLFVMILLGVASFSTSHIQERSANNIRLQSMAFEAASAGASNAINFFVQNRDSFGTDGLCGSMGHLGWDAPTAWGPEESVGDAVLRQRLYCLADVYSCADDPDLDDCYKRPVRSQLFVHSEGRVMNGDTAIAIRDVEVRLDRGVISFSGDGCGAICLPGCDHYDGEKNTAQCDKTAPDCIVVGNSNQFSVIGEDGVGPAITTGCPESTSKVEYAINNAGSGRMDNYHGDVSAVGMQDPWDYPEKVADLRDSISDLAQSEECGNCYHFPDGLPDGQGSNDFGTTVLNEAGTAVDRVENPSVVFVEGDAVMGGNDEGAGILFVTGKLEWGGTPKWNGLIVAIGGSFYLNGGGNDGMSAGEPPGKTKDDALPPEVVGGGSMVILNLEPDNTFGTTGIILDGGGNSAYAYDCDMLAMAWGLLDETGQGIYPLPDCEPDTGLFGSGPRELVIKSWRENIGWRECQFNPGGENCPVEES